MLFVSDCKASVAHLRRAREAASRAGENLLRTAFDDISSRVPETGIRQANDKIGAAIADLCMQYEEARRRDP